MAITI